MIAVELPKHRACMHLDTVMTHIDTFSVYPEVVRKEAQCWTLTPDGRGGLQRTQESDLLHAIEKALGIGQVRLITTGGDAFEAEREQWNDANNVLTLRPGGWSATSATSGPMRSTTKRGSPCCRSPATSWDADAAAHAA